MFKYLSSDSQLRRESLAIQAQERRVQSANAQQRYSPRESGQSSGGNGPSGRSYHQGSPVLVPTSEEYETAPMVSQGNVPVSAAALAAAVATATATSTAAGQLGSPAPPYSPPMTDGIRVASSQQQSAQQHHHLVAAYADAGAGGIKYDADAAAAAAAATVAAERFAAAAAAATENIKVSNTYTTLETVAIPPSQAVQYAQYIPGETFQQAPTYTHPKSGDQLILAYPSPAQLGSRVGGVSLFPRLLARTLS